MKRVACLLSLLLLCAAASASTAAPQTPAKSPAARRAAVQVPAIRHVIVISVDGMMPATYLQPDRHGLKVPTLRELVRNCAYSEGVRGVFPTVTYPSHTSMVTGVNPGPHGIVANQPWDPYSRLEGHARWYTEDIRVPTLYQLAYAKGLRTGLIYWPVSMGAKATALVPEFWRSEEGSEEDQKLQRVLSTPGLLEAVARRFPGFWPDFRPPRAGDEALTDVAVHLIETQRPHLLLLHIFDTDHFQHRDGPLAGRALHALEKADAQIARVIAAAKKAGIWPDTLLVVLSDHGFARLSQRVRPGILLREKGLITLDERNRVTDWKAWLLAGGGYGYIYVRDENDYQTRQTLLDTFRPLVGRSGSGIGRVLTQEEIAALGGDRNAFLALEAADDYGIAPGYTGDYVFASAHAGHHGLLPDRPEMFASLLVCGPHVVPGKIERARLIDVAPTVARWLGLKLERAEGRPLPIVLRSARR